MARDITRPLRGSSVVILNELVQAHEELFAEQKLTRILCSKSIVDPKFIFDDTVEVFVKTNTKSVKMFHLTRYF